MPRNPVVLVHGYSDTGRSFGRWAQLLQSKGYQTAEIATCTYQTLTNEVTIRDIAEGFNRALMLHDVLRDEAKPFDAIVHSTGMLVVRAWLTAYGRTPQRLARLKRLLALAPATFGSPLAHKGRSWIGSIFKGNKHLGPDFLEAGDLVLDALELGSRFTWDLADADLFGEHTFYGPDADTPYVFTLCGDRGYEGLKSLVNEKGSDGTVRWAGCALNARKLHIDLTQQTALKDRIKPVPGPNIDVPVHLVAGYNHGSILTEPDGELVELVIDALEVDSKDDLDRWRQRADAVSAETSQAQESWQQFVVRAVDERGDPITDYHLQLVTVDEDGAERELADFDLDVHAYAADKSYRCLHANVTELRKLKLRNLWVRVMASTGSRLVAYWGHGADRPKGAAPAPADWDARLDISQVLDNGNASSFFRPYTTTLVELKLNREPLPLDAAEWPFLCRLGKPDEETPSPTWAWAERQVG